MKDYDVLVVGAGIIGLSTAYHIKLANPKLKVLVVEKYVAAGLGSTVNSAAAFRCFFSSNLNFELADSSVNFYMHLQEDLGFDLRMHWCGYLWAFTREKYEKVIPILKELGRKGLEYEEYSPQKLKQTLGLRFTFDGDLEAKKLGLGTIHRAVFIPKAGLIDVMSLVHFYESEFVRMGGEMMYHTEVKKLIVEPTSPLGLPGEPYFWQDKSVIGVETSDGIIRAKKTVIAAGAWLSQLLDTVGIECFVKARKRQVFSVKANTEALKKLLFSGEFSSEKYLPFIILPKPSVYIRPNLEGEGFGIAYSDEFPRAFSLEEHPKPEPEFFQQGLLPVLAKYFPQFEGAVSSGGFAGLYEINNLDEQPVVFEDHGIVAVGGGSGSGIMKADAIGRVAAAVCEGKESASLFGDRLLKVSNLGINNRQVEKEQLII
jgi:glycine/D-amino acid oxidase-like deaminating enzyme